MLISVPAGKELHSSNDSHEETGEGAICRSMERDARQKRQGNIIPRAEVAKKGMSRVKGEPRSHGAMEEAPLECGDRASARDASLKQRVSGEEMPWPFSGPFLCCSAVLLTDGTQKKVKGMESGEKYSDFR